MLLALHKCKWLFLILICSWKEGWMKLVMALLTNWQLTGPVKVNQKMAFFGVCSVSVWVRTWVLKKLGLKAFFCCWASKYNYWEISPNSKFHYWAAKHQISWVIAPWWIFIPFLWPSGSLLLPAPSSLSNLIYILHR